jgi:oligopeptide/dipeptide ABC transporter ATP-binding protein
MSLLEVDDLAVRYPGQGEEVRAVDGVSFAVDTGETLAIVGESGCGKSSLVNAVAGLVAAADGEVVYGGQELIAAKGSEARRRRRGMQMVFQDPLDALDPRMSVGKSVEEPLRLAGMGKAERAARGREMFDRVDLPAALYGRYPHELSGGQQQRVVIARAIAPSPSLVVLDEPTASLDFLVREAIVELLGTIQRQTDCAFVFISHDIGTVRQIADQVGVMYLGRMVELGEASVVLGSPKHPYTQALFDAAPIPDPALRARRTYIAPDPGDLEGTLEGCPYRARCPFADAVCETRPALVPQDGRDVACHHIGASQAPQPTTEAPA